MKNKKIRPLDNIVSKKLENEEILLDLKSGTYFGLNETASFIFDLLKKGQNSESIVTDLSEKFDIDDITAKQDVMLFLRELKSNSLVCEEP